MVQYIPQPPNREGVVIFGDGDEAALIDIQNSDLEGYYLVIFSPTDKMRWTKQIQDNEYNKYNRAIWKVYKKDMCLQLSFSTDYPLWVVMCDYRGNEDTPMMKLHGVLILRKRDLEKENKNLRIEINQLRKQQRKRIQSPEESEIERVEWLERITKAQGAGRTIPPQQNEFGQEAVAQ